MDISSIRPRLAASTMTFLSDWALERYLYATFFFFFFGFTDGRPSFFMFVERFYRICHSHNLSLAFFGFRFCQVVQGFEEAVSGLKPGARRRFIVAPELGYATSGTKPGTSPGPLPPDWGARRSIAAHAKEPLLFEVLVERVKPAR